MAARRILQLGDPTLRAVSARVPAAFDARAVFVDLRDTLHEFRRSHGFGRGISAIQIGESLRLIYIEFDAVSYPLRNPEFVYRSEEKFCLWDDCFSFPGLMVWLERSERVAVRYEDAGGAERILEAAGSLSELLQHEMDHLDGILAVDRAIGLNGLATREEFVRRYAVATTAQLPPS
ncbi:MAG: peptide deformylase [Bryobacteraceae bacterium]